MFSRIPLEGGWNTRLEESLARIKLGFDLAAQTTHFAQVGLLKALPHHHAL